MKRFECVPNFSEGRDRAVVDALAEAGRSVAGVTVLDVESNADHNRAVISLVGEGGPLSEAVFRMMRLAVEKIDLRGHTGEHPRMGAVDVVPFVPLGESTTEEAVELANRLAERSWKELGLPVYLYGSAARRPERSDLAYLRRGQFEGIRDSIASDPDRLPDFGGSAVHPSAGIVAIGARPVLVAFNAYLATPDVGVAKKVAKAVRARDGGLAEVKALGFEIKERGRAQVSMNLTDFRKTPVHRALEAVRREAARYGVGVEESEIVGLVPEDALFDAAEFYLQLNRFDRGTVLERKVRAAETQAASGVAADRFASRPLADLVERLAARTPTPGGGTAAAVCGALGAALAGMVVAYSGPATGLSEPLAAVATELGRARHRFLELADEDSAAYEEVRTARRGLRSAGTDTAAGTSARDQLLAATRRAAEVPLATAELARDTAHRLESVRSSLKATIESDRVAAESLLNAAALGALANVKINLADLDALGMDTSALASAVSRLEGPAPG
jgi:glutamate formiminotransferase/formiminotetrahydrofolate cyclodeaminase